jgi:guanylate kinase
MKLLMLVGPSGVGKGTIVRELRKHRSDLWLSISATTRTARVNEVDGVDYYFVTRTEFEQMIATDQLLEWAEYAGNYYGTPRAAVQQHLSQGDLVVLEIEIAGARQIKKRIPEVLDVMVLPPSFADLQSRLEQRGTEGAAARRERLELAEVELAAVGEFSHCINNDTIESAIEQLLLLLPAQ